MMQKSKVEREWGGGGSQYKHILKRGNSEALSGPEVLNK